jgi:hypothetical protein
LDNTQRDNRAWQYSLGGEVSVELPVHCIAWSKLKSWPLALSNNPIDPKETCFILIGYIQTLGSGAIDCRGRCCSLYKKRPTARHPAIPLPCSLCLTTYPQSHPQQLWATALFTRHKIKKIRDLFKAAGFIPH